MVSQRSELLKDSLEPDPSLDFGAEVSLQRG